MQCVDLRSYVLLSLSPHRLHGVRHDVSQLQYAAVAHHPLPRERLAVWLPAARGGGDIRRLGDGGVDSVRPRASAHGDLWHRRQTGHRAPGPEEQKHPGHKGAALLHRRPGSVRSAPVILYALPQTDPSTCCCLLLVLFTVTIYFFPC